MGADDGGGGGSKPHPAANNPQAPCDQGPGWKEIFENRDRPRIVGGHQRQQQQVGDSESYAVAGKLLLAAAGALAGVLLALVALYLYNSARRRRLGLSGGGGGRRLDRSLAIIGGGEESRHDGGAAPSPRGLDPAVLRALPVVAAGAGAGDCAVCLTELEPGEKARALPRCGHRFHAECIDAWFRGNATCPLCRADVVAPADEAPSSAPPQVRVDVAGLDAAAAAAAKAPAMGRLPSGTDLDKTRRVFASTRSVSF
ncbi:hypothetical protein EJB05_30816, partial [Eragrostis curvula]